MNPILHKTLALTLSVSLLNAYAVPAFAAEIISADKTITGETFENETGNKMGGVFVLNEPTAATTGTRGDMVVNIKDTHFTNNSTSAGGYGGVIFQYTGTLNIDNATFTGNTADWDGGAISTAYPRISQQPDGAGKLVVKNSTFDSNSTTVYSAGAIGLYSEGEISNSTFTNNNAGGHDPADATDGGGALYLGGWAQATLKGNLFEGNSSNRGGAIGTTAGGISQYAYLRSTGDIFKNNTATKFGGAIFNQFATDNNYVNDATFDGNKASKYGGAIYNSGLLNVKNSNFTNNTANAGGAIFNGGNMDITNSRFSNNTASKLGGVLVVSDAKAAKDERGTAVTNITNSIFENNYANEGGVIFQNNASIKIDNSKFLNNKAGWMGVIEQTTPYPGPKDSAGKLIISNSEFTGNASEQWSAGAIGVFSEAEISNTTFNNNSILSDAPAEARDGGGAIYVGGWGQLAMKDSSFTGNKGNRGGAIASTNEGQGTAEDPVAYIKLDNVTFADNTASEEGGAIANYLIGGNDNPNTIKDSTFTGNKAGTKGGAIFNATKAVLNLEGNNTFADNTANGAANDIYNDGTLNINSGTTTLAGGITGNGALNVKGSSVLNLGQSTAEADSIAFDNGSTLAVEFGNDTMGNLKANTITIGENASDSTKLLVTLSRDFLTDTTGISHELTNGSDVKNGSFAMADASNALYNVTFDNNIVTAVRKTQEETNQEIANAGGNTNDMNVINAFTNSSDMGSAVANQTADIINNLAQTDVAAAVSATKAVAPEAASAKQVVHGSIAREVFNSLQTRMDTAVNAAPQAFALDDEQKVQNQGSYSVWMQGLLNKSHKEATDTSAFTGNSTGLAFGADTNLADDILLGAGYAYTHTNVSSDGRHDRILGDNFFVYGQYRPSRFYVQASLGYGDSKYEEAKYLPGLNINADYHIKSYSAQATAGYELTDMFTPTLGLRYINLQQEGYKDSADQSVSAEQNSYLSGVVGVTIKNEVYSSSVLHLLPQLHAGLSYDFVSDNAQGNVFLPKGSNYSISGERLHRLGFEAGASVSANLSDNWEALLGYEGNFRQDYNSHTGTLKVRYLF